MKHTSDNKGLSTRLKSTMERMGLRAGRAMRVALMALVSQTVGITANITSAWACRRRHPQVYAGEHHGRAV